MRYFSDITYKYIKNQKKRTALTLLGIILSIALITAIGTMFVSVQQSEIKTVISQSGDFHIAFQDSERELYNELKNHTSVEKVGLMNEVAQANLKDDVKINITSLNDEAFDIMPINITKGEIAQNENEILIEKWTLNYFENKPEIGDAIKLKLENGEEKEFILKGILDNNSGSQYSGESTGFIRSNEFISGKSAIFVKISPKVSIKDTVSELKKKAPENFFTNERLLILMGESDDEETTESIFAIVGFLIGIIVICTVAVIYNAFHISVLERINQFGIIRSVGASPKQIRKIVFKEAGLMSLIAIPLGLFSGVLAMKIVLLIIGKNASEFFKEINILISPKVLIISAAVGLVSVYLSAFLPALRAGRVSPLEAITNRGAYKKEKIKRKKRKSKLSKLFRIEFVMANKNIKRNKKRFMITVFSMIISIVMFVVFNSFMQMGNSFNDNNEEYNLDYKVYSRIIRDTKKEIPQEFYNKVKEIEGVDKIYKLYEKTYTSSLIDENKISEEYNKYFSYEDDTFEQNGEKVVDLSTILTAYDKETMELAKEYLRHGEIDTEKMNNENGVILFNTSELYNQEEDKMDNVIFTNIKPGDEITINLDTRYKEDKEYPNKIMKVKVMAVLEKSPLGESYNYDNIEVITTKNVYEKITEKMIYEDGKEGKLTCNGLNIKIKEGLDKEKISEKMNELGEEYDYINVIDMGEQLKKENQQKLEISIFLYGFVAVIALIGSVNIINTVSTNLILRQREFGSLKAIGMTMSQIKRMVYLEGIMYGVISAVVGCAIGSALSYYLFHMVTGVRGIQWTLSWSTLIIVSIASIGIGLISVVIPLRRINKVNVIEAIRNQE